MPAPARQASIYLLNAADPGAADLAPYLAWLSAGETERYQRFVRRERQRQFLLGRILLRQALSPLLQIPAGKLSLTEQSGRAPRLDGWPDIGFSISHSGAWLACAVSATTGLGLDIERLNPARDFHALAQHAFDADEIAWLQARPAASLAADFYRLWSSKEARFKVGAPGAHCLQLPHPELAIALCSAQPLAQTPSLLRTSLSPEPVPNPG
ncbi:MAG: 4'-phosphopantetheinyl transferase superfamily protein [Burkholderiales bacterium]|nr:4'-phosphopantetheinyl transferase superfamily protein [Burkholderiales bacterium]